MYPSRTILAIFVFLIVGDAFRTKSSRTTEVLAEAGLVKAKCTQTLKVSQALAHKVAVDAEEIYGNAREMVKKVERVMSQAADEGGPQYDVPQAEVENARKWFDECAEGALDYVKKTDEISNNEGQRTGELGDIQEARASVVWYSYDHVVFDNPLLDEAAHLKIWQKLLNLSKEKKEFEGRPPHGNSRLKFACDGGKAHVLQTWQHAQTI